MPAEACQNKACVCTGEADDDEAISEGVTVPAAMTAEGDINAKIAEAIEKERRFIARYGPSLTPAQREFYEAEEKKRLAGEAKRRRNAEIEKVERAAREKRKHEQAMALVKSGKLTVKIGNSEVQVRGDDMSVLCPACHASHPLRGDIEQYCQTVQQGTPTNIRPWGGACFEAPWYGLPVVFRIQSCQECGVTYTLTIMYTGW